MTPMRTLYIDMDSFFASVEQHENPTLRGRPVGIVAVDGTSGACVAASYEAKAFGVKTGTSVRDAKRLCPGIAFVQSRHRLYARYNLRIADLLDTMVEVERIRSIDEFQITLGTGQQTIDQGRALIDQLKAALAREISPHIRFSAGLGPSPLLAKIAGKLRKPNGWDWLGPENMPDRLSALKLDDLPGISKGVLAKLYRARVWDIPALYRLDPKHARLIWRSVEGERFVRALQGEYIPIQDTQRHGYGNSKVLAPAFRPIGDAFKVSAWLVEKASARLRRDGMVASVFSMSCGYLHGGGYARSIKIEQTQDTRMLKTVNRSLWEGMWNRDRPRHLISVGVHLGGVIPLKDRSGDLFSHYGAGERSNGETLSAVIDQINGRYGQGAVQWGGSAPHHGFFERVRLSQGSIRVFCLHRGLL